MSQTNTQMKAWKLNSTTGSFTLSQVSLPTVRPGSVLIKLKAIPVANNMKHMISGKVSFFKTPKDEFSIGTYGVGQVVDVGSDVYHLKKGMRVYVSPQIVAHENVREPAQILLGATHFETEASKQLQQDWKDGTMAQYILVPTSVVSPIDDDLDHISSALLATAAKCAVPYGGYVKGRLTAGEVVIVNGATGAYGCCAVLMALAMGASRVVAAGRNEENLKAILDVGGKRVVGVKLSGDVEKDAAALRGATGIGGAHLAFDMLGYASDANSTISSLNALLRGGRLVLMGSMVVPLPINYNQVLLNNIEILGCFMYPTSAFERINDLIRGGLLNIDAFDVKEYPLSELMDAMDYAEKSKPLECVVILD